MKEVKVGYEMGTGQLIEISPSHLIVTGVTQKSGKTTTLEALAHRTNGYKIVVFKTKVGEKTFQGGTPHSLYLRLKSDWQFISSLIEASMKKKLNDKFISLIIQCSKKIKNLQDFVNNVEEFLDRPKLSISDRDGLTNLFAYMEMIIPKLDQLNFCDKLNLVEGVNVFDLTEFAGDEEVQSLVIGSVLDEITLKYSYTVTVIPESWKFIPMRRGSPCKLQIESLIRQGATNNNFIWIDSQDMANISKAPLKQISTWILGYQSEINEVKHTLEQIPEPPDLRPSVLDIMTLKIGQFFVCTSNEVRLVYVQPIWLEDDSAKAISLGRESLSGESYENDDRLNKLFALALLTENQELAKEVMADLLEKYNKRLLDDLRGGEE